MTLKNLSRDFLMTWYLLNRLTKNSGTQQIAFMKMKTFYLIIGLLCFKAASGQGSSVDTMINQIGILDATSVRLKLKADTSKIDLSFELRDSAIPDVKIKNQKGDQLLTMSLHPGDSKYQFSEFKVSYIDKMSDDLVTIKLKDEDLKTGKGIILGIKKSDLLKLLGNPTTTLTGKGQDIVKYKITDQDSGILKKYRKAEYIASYKFKEDKLVEFHFGFVYP
jgi:hypothetical protein